VVLAWRGECLAAGGVGSVIFTMVVETVEIFERENGREGQQNGEEAGSVETVLRYEMVVTDNYGTGAGRDVTGRRRFCKPSCMPCRAAFSA